MASIVHNETHSTSWQIEITCPLLAYACYVELKNL